MLITSHILRSLAVTYPFGFWTFLVGKLIALFSHFLALWNADFFEIGNRDEADTELVVWAPELSYDLVRCPQINQATISVRSSHFAFSQRHVVGAYATYVKDSRKNGSDTVVVHLRTRIADIEGRDCVCTFALHRDTELCVIYIVGYPWVGLLTPNCTEGALNWLCPDHIWFTDTEMGALHVAMGRLFPLCELNLF